MSELEAEAIARGLERLGAPQGRPLTVVASTASTNDDARAAAAAGAPAGAAFVADAQTRGRGRGGHDWHSPAGENVYLSVVARPRVPAIGLAPLTLAVGVAVARALAPLVAAEVWIKWPNDVLAGPSVGGALPGKLAGVLVEGTLRGTEVASVIVGVGVNVHTRAFPPDLASRATSLALLGAGPLDRSEIAAALIAGIDAAALRYERDRLASFIADLGRLDVLRGRHVDASGVSGVGEGIDVEGRLLVRRASGEVVRVGTGEVSA